MVKDEDVCLHCGLCAERCPTGAWDMKKSFIDMTHAGETPRVRRPAAAAAAAVADAAAD
jgi:NAD-dependent dihydropyrimidine dehydrogenase PreA subunit